MGAKDSKRSCLSYEDAVKRMSDAEFKRICEAFKRLTGGGQFLNLHAFTQSVLGDGVPDKISEWLFTACGGGQKGIALRDLICGLVLITKGTQEEKIKFLWTLYSNDSGTYIIRNDFQHTLQIEGMAPSNNKNWDRSLFRIGQDRIDFEHFKAWIQYNKDATALSKWLLTYSRVSLSSEVESPTFYQTLAGVTHLEERDICELEKCFWSLQSTSPTGQLDLACIRSLISPPIPKSACDGLFLALDVNRDGHVDFKELCCGISAACRGPTAERMKFCFKIFDTDRDGCLNQMELQHMIEILLFVARENSDTKSGINGTSLEEQYVIALDNLERHLCNGTLTQDEFLIWSVADNPLIAPLLELIFQVCHVSLGLKPNCRHHEHEIVIGWLMREERRGYSVGQFWYLISTEWWQSWQNYTTSPRSSFDHCNCISEQRLQVEEGIVCDESYISNEYTNHSNEFASNSTESVGDLLSRGDSCSIASSSGVSSSSGIGFKRNHTVPGPIENINLVSEPICRIATLTGEGGRLKKDIPLVQHHDFELVPDSLWKALALWYGGPLPLPRQVIKPPDSQEVELELYPVNLRILRHQHQPASSSTAWSNVVGGYGAAAAAGIPTPSVTPPKRCLTHTAAFSRLSNIRQVIEFLCSRLMLRTEDVRLWHIKETSVVLLEDEVATLQELGIMDNDQILLEVRNKDLTWPEELGALASGSPGFNSSLISERRPTITLPPGATGLHNLGNTCFMNAALQAVSNTRPLTQYFKRDAQLCELNSSNPLGTKGQVARRYAELCRELWTGSTRSVAPLKLRWCVGKHAPHLGSGEQHDSQELLAWLLDALHEDLNRVTGKQQYIELKDSGGRPDTVVAEEAWQQHLARHRSIITDLFYGQLKSKVTCQTCGHESVRFDAFNLLSLPLPMESYTLCEILVITLNGETPIKYGLRLNSEAKYIELKEQLYQLCGVEPERLLLAEVACSKIKILPDDVKINPNTAAEIFGYELPSYCDTKDSEMEEEEEVTEVEVQSPLARSPEVRGGSALCMPNILCFKNKPRSESISSCTRLDNGFGKTTMAPASNCNIFGDNNITKTPSYLVAIHRKCVRQETYFLSQQKSKPSLFGVPLLLGCRPNSTCQSLYEAVWRQVTRLLSPLPQSDQTNHATDCDDSLGYEFPFTLKIVSQGGQVCAVCHWTQFCRGCKLPCNDDLVFNICTEQNEIYIAIDWDPTALHLRYQSTREKLWIEHKSVSICRRLHTEPIDIDYCLKAFTSEESLETKYHCSNCQDKQPATKKLQIWRLPPILIIHLKRFDYVNGKWAKTQKVVNFPFKDFDPTAYLASVPQETILRHRHLIEKFHSNEEYHEEDTAKLVDIENDKEITLSESGSRNHSRERLESTSLMKTPIVDEDLKDYHEHKLLPGQDPFDLKYQLYAVVSHSGLLNGGHYISYACNPNGNWYCYNDSSCREVLTEVISAETENNNRNSKNCAKCTPSASRKNSQPNDRATSNNFSRNENNHSTYNSIEEVKSDSYSTLNESKVSLNSYKCAYSDVKIPKIDTSSAYILFYERSGLDYKPYLPEIVNANGQNPPQEEELEEKESELRKQCSIQ